MKSRLGDEVWVHYFFTCPARYFRHSGEGCCPHADSVSTWPNIGSEVEGLGILHKVTDEEPPAWVERWKNRAKPELTHAQNNETFI